MNHEDVKPCRVVWAHLGAQKRRPWLVLWVDDVDKVACMVALTASSGFPYTVPTGAGKQQYAWAAAWVQIWPTTALKRATDGAFEFSPLQSFLIEQALLKRFDLRSEKRP